MPTTSTEPTPEPTEVVVPPEYAEHELALADAYPDTYRLITVEPAKAKAKG